jgi:predicted dehydrogenase
MILGCLERGLHILVEKPMVMDPIEAGRVVRKWRYSGVTLLVTVQHMYSPRIQATKKLIDEGELGEVKFIYWPMFRGDWAVKGEDLRQEHELNWMYMKTLQGDVLVADSVHYFTQSNYLLGVKPVRAAALGGVIDYHDGRNTMDHCCAVVEYEGGAKLSHNMLLFARNYAEEGVRIIGDKASLSFQRENLIIGPRSPSKPERAAPIPKTIYSPSGDDGMPDMYQDFFRCARSGRLPLCNALSGANGVLVAYACQQSAYRKEVIEIADLDPVTPG